jgi:hypothetical protein
MEEGWVFEGGNDSLYHTSGSTGIGKNFGKKLWHGCWRTGYTMVLQVYRRPLSGLENWLNSENSRLPLPSLI